MELAQVKAGLKNTVSEEVTADKTAAAMGSGSLPVYATPAMTCLMEKAATEAVEKFMPEGWTTVGISLHVAHTAATPVGLSGQGEIFGQSGRQGTILNFHYKCVARLFKPCPSLYYINRPFY